MRILPIIFQLVGYLLKKLFQPAFPEKLHVRKVIDGDSLDCVDKDGNRHQLRIRGIDAPEMSQEHGIESKTALQALAENKTIILQDPEIDKFGRIAARIKTTDGINPGMELLKEGHAWACPNRAKLSENLAETTAKLKGKGIWNHRQPKEPWKHRQDQNNMQM